MNKGTLFEGKNWIDEKISLQNSKIGFAIFTGENIGKYTCIVKEVQLILGVHPAHTYVSTHPAFYNPNRAIFSFVNDEPNSFDQFKHKKIEQLDLVIRSDVWVETDVKIMRGGTIKNGSVVGVGEIVTRDVSPMQ